MATQTLPRVILRAPDRFDLIMGSAVAALIALVVGVIALGDRAGVGVTMLEARTGETFGADPAISSGDVLRLQFSEPMDAASVQLAIEPSLPGALRWSGASLTFAPDAAFLAGTRYTVTLKGGARSQNGRVVLQDHQWTVQVRQPRVVYLAPAIPTRKGDPSNLYMVNGSAAPIQLTNAPYGVEDFAPSPDGTRIAFSQYDTEGQTDLYLLDVATKSTRRLTRCIGATCRAPAWNPDGVRVLYERADSIRFDSDARAWIVDVDTLATQPLFTEQRWLAQEPIWSPDGSAVTMYDSERSAVVIVDVATGHQALLQTLENNSWQFSRDSKRVVYLQLQQTPLGVMRGLEVAEFRDGERTVHPLPPPDGAQVDDALAVFHPDGTRLAVMRRYMDGERATEKYQVYEITLATGEAVPIAVDPNYAHGNISYSPDGMQVLMQRYPYMEQDAQPGIWVYDARSRTLTQIAQNGYLPEWLP